MKRYMVLLAAILLVAGSVMGGAGVSNTLTLIVNEISGPTSGTAMTGEAVQLVVNTAGNGPFDCLWRKDGIDIGAPNSSIYNIASAALTDAGDYDCVATSAGGLPITSSTATLTVLQTLEITAQPANATKHEGEEHTFTTTAIGDGTLFYQWYKDGTPISGATAASYQIASCAQGTDNGDYYCDVTDNNATISTITATLAVLPAGVYPELQITFNAGTPGQLSNGVFDLQGADFLSLFQDQAGVTAVSGSPATVTAIVIRLTTVPASVAPALAGIPTPSGSSAAVTFSHASLTDSFSGLILVGFRFAGAGTTNYNLRNTAVKVTLTYGGTDQLATSGNGWILDLTAPIP